MNLKNVFNILAITDGKLSSVNQCNSITNGLKKSSKKKISVESKVVDYGYLNFLPNIFIYYFLILKSFFIKKPFKHIDFIISCGRISAPYNLFLKKKIGSKNCHILKPYFKENEFDKLIIPEHDLTKRQQKNFISTFGTLVDESNFEVKKETLEFFKKGLSKKRKISFFIGGDGKSSKIENYDLENVLKQLNLLSKNFQIIYCFSRRTSLSVKKFVRVSANKESFFYPYKKINPYWILFSISDYLFVTGDSISMISDSLTSGKPTYIVPIKKVKKKIEKFNDIIFKNQMAKIYKGKLERWNFNKLSEAKNVCKNLKNLLKL